QSSVNQFHLDALIKFIDRGPTAISTEEQKQLTALGFILGQNCLIPILRNKDPIYQQGLHLAGHIVQILRDELQSLDIAELIEADFKAALIIFFHEVYPTMLETLIEKGIAIPGVLEGEESAPLSPSFFISGKEKSS
ncbi:MAG: hypothetical protein GWN67_03765, partial [Phycisphaerae bacterium]|nr:hypothetical protein [Gammaproteobacteria bacterium]NIU07965.1 hypothetical protein [Phycisphaerae bacterium]NIU55530.1 hypothetical protein [Phycisphaerae bacterium]NIW10562.1 hypothetical protein [Gammaproteobacteria bacterium]NIW93272.1 hypothetical protein [Phycisphaerae bacterium]